MHPDTQTAAAVGMSFADLLRYNESEALNGAYGSRRSR
jgi:hypothetical protein